MRKKLIVLLFFLLLTTSLSVAQESILLDTVTVKAYFRQGHGTLDSLFRNNGSRLDSFARRLVPDGYCLSYPLCPCRFRHVPRGFL